MLKYYNFDASIIYYYFLLFFLPVHPAAQLHIKNEFTEIHVPPLRHFPVVHVLSITAVTF